MVHLVSMAFSQPQKHHVGLDRKDSHDAKLKQTHLMQRELAPRLFSLQLSGKLELSLSWAAGEMCMAEVEQL